MLLSRLAAGAGWGISAGTLDVILSWDHEYDKRVLYTGAAHWALYGMLLPFLRFGSASAQTKSAFVGIFGANAALAISDKEAVNTIGALAPYSLGLGAIVGWGTLFAPVSAGYTLGALGLGSLAGIYSCSDQKSTGIFKPTNYTIFVEKKPAGNPAAKDLADLKVHQM
jgi:hypothetical protein